MKRLFPIFFALLSVSLFAQNEYRVNTFRTQFPSIRIVDSLNVIKKTYLNGDVNIHSSLRLKDTSKLFVDGVLVPNGYALGSASGAVSALEVTSPAQVTTAINNALAPYVPGIPTLADVTAEGAITDEMITFSSGISLGAPIQNNVAFAGNFIDANGSLLADGQILVSNGTAMVATTPLSISEVRGEINDSLSAYTPAVPTLSEVTAAGAVTSDVTTFNGTVIIGANMATAEGQLSEGQGLVSNGTRMDAITLLSPAEIDQRIADELNAYTPDVPTLAQVVTSGNSTSSPVAFNGVVSFGGNIALSGSNLAAGQGIVSNGSTLTATTLITNNDINTRLNQKLDSLFGYVDIGDSDGAFGYSPSAPIRLPNNGNGAQTSIAYAPTPITTLADIWNTSDDAFNFSDLPLGTVLHIRLDVTVITTVANQDIEILMYAGGTSPFTLNVINDVVKESGPHRITEEISFYIGTDDVRNNSAYFTISSSSSADVTVNGWFVDLRLNN